ncbi:hypothetical protein A0128_12220 [Leptospira tipperaryensis]|uniref:Galactose oxidase n=1 Tax=Leptospira tipperaryensis TaxID=2564040 RepID=A0A1D7UY73_9LEPT|nr:hypothetical protein [Leptospira tipperaryensis]AOP34546.1 hypothetical protein A0128_12220 [Leptospira tipperaryensis]
MRKEIPTIFLILLLSSCAQADKFSMDSSNPLALLGQIGWTLGSIPANTGTGLQFVAVGSNCSSWTSSDGISWKYSNARFSGCVDGAVSSVAFGNGTWVAVGTLTANGGCGIWSSKDGETWARSNCAAGLVSISGTPTSVVKNLYTVTFGGGFFFAAGEHIASQTGVGFYGQISSDGSAWQFLSIPDGSTYIGSDYYFSSSYSSVHSEVYFSGFHNVNPEIVQMSVPSTASSSISISTASTFKTGILALKSGKILVFGGDDDTNPTASITKMATTAPGIGASSILNTGVPGFINTAVEGKDKIVVFGNQCTLDFYSLSLQVWHPPISSPAPEMSNCSRLDWMSSAYNSTLDLFVSGARVTGSVPTAFSYSKTGLPADWTVVAQADAGSPGPSILGIATK